MSFLIRLMVGMDLTYKVIAEENQKITFGSSEKDTVHVKNWIPGQLKLCIKRGLLQISGKKVSDLRQTSMESSEIGIEVSKSLNAAINWLPYTGRSEKSFQLPYRGIVTIGRNADNSISLNKRTISGYHAVIRCENGMVRIEDGNNGKPSSNGTFLNGKRITKAVMKSGDVLDIMNVRISMINMSLYLDNADGILRINQVQVSKPSQAPALSLKEPIYRRSPRIREGLPQQDIVLAKAPAKGHSFQKRKGMVTSLLSSGAMIGASVATGMISPALLAARAAGLVAPVANMALNHGDNKKGKKQWEKQELERRERYGAYIESQKAIIQLTADQQRKILTSENPAPECCLSVVGELQPTLWERRPGDSDFLNVRIGMGYEPICVNVKTPADALGFQMEEDETEVLAKQIVEETRIVDNIPARIALGQYGTIGIIGQRAHVAHLLKNLIIALTTAHFYEDVRIVGIFDEKEKKTWEMLRWLPHVWDSEKQSRFLAFDEINAERLSDAFYEVLHQRLAEEQGDEQRKPIPHYIFLLGSRDYMKHSKLMADLLKNAPAAGATTIFAYDLGDCSSQHQRTYLPPECQFVIDTDDINGPCAYEFARADRRFMFTLDAEINDQDFDRFCRTMSAIRVESRAGKLELPGGITFLEGMGVSNVRDLNVWEHWTKHGDKVSLSAPLAIMASGKMLELDIGDFNQPPVSLVAGMAGSGKSEFLKTWILSLAVYYSPEELSIVIIDYKGGSMAHSVEQLPHVVGKITDIESGDIMRPLASLSYEIRRRENIFKENGVLDYKEYVKGLREGKFHEPLPMFLIICDEFAELKLQHREFMTELIRVARLGRSVGIRLVLATQSPAGVVDQDLFDNSRFQICLKVQNAAASKSMIARPDAARITQNGRAYVRAGSDEIFELVQSYWTGAPYLGNRDKKASAGNQVRIVDMAGQRIKTVWEEKTRFKSEANELQAAIRYINAVADQHDIKKMPCPWKPELPKSFGITELGIRGGFDGSDWRPALEWMQLPIGIYDMPEIQAQGIQYLNFETDGHYGIYGLPGTGKTTLLKTIIMGLGLYYSPKDVNLYILDLGSQTLRLFEKMPHVGGVALGSEEEKLQKTALVLDRLLSERKKEFARHGVSTLKNYREHIADDMPAIVVAIDNLLPLFELCPAFEPLIYKIASEGSSYGVYLIYTANSSTSLRYKLTQNIHSGIAFEMNSKTDYTEVVGKVESPSALGKIKGRGFFKGSNAPILFQAALYGVGSSEMEWGNWVKEKINQMNQVWDGPSAETVPVVPNVVKLADLTNSYVERDLIPVGMDCVEAKPICMDFRQSCCSMVVGIPGSGKSAMLVTLSKMLKAGHFEQRLYILDSTRKGLSSLMTDAEEYARTDDLSGVDAVLTLLIRELIARQKDQAEEKEQLGSRFENNEWINSYPQLCLLIDDLRETIELVDQDDSVYKRLNALVKNAAGLGLILLAASRAEDVKELHTTDPVVSKFVSGQNGLAVSGNALLHSYYQPKNLGFEEKTAELKEGFGLLYGGGQVHKVKLMEV